MKMCERISPESAQRARLARSTIEKITKRTQFWRSQPPGPSWIEICKTPLGLLDSKTSSPAAENGDLGVRVETHRGV